MKKLLSTAAAIGVFVSTSMLPALAADISATTLPSISSTTNADVTTNGANMNIQITGDPSSVGTLNWNTYNVGSDASVNYEFTAHNQTALNIVAASGGLSQIYGSITNSGCTGCGYADTGKVILINPNGVIFGSGANVNLNSFTVSTMDGTYDNDNRKLTLTKGADQSDFGIVVEDGAEIYGDKNVTFASNNITLYEGSKISTSTVANVDDTTYGKIKLVTADGVNFTYYNNGAVSSISDITNSSDKMVISVNGELTSANIDIRNYSTDTDSEINLNGATLKAVKAVSGDNGNIWLTASNKIVVGDSALTTVNADGAEDVDGGDIQLFAGQKASFDSSGIDAVGDVDIISQGSDVVVGNSTITSAKDVALTASGSASAQESSTISAENITIDGATRGQVNASSLTADGDVDITGGELAWTDNADINANNINITSDGSILINSSSYKADKITLDAAEDITATALDLNERQTNLYAGNDINAELINAGNRDNGLVAEAGNDMTITTAGTLSVSRLVSGNNMTINADYVIAGYPLTTEIFEEDGDSTDRSYIEAGGTFTSNVTNDNFEVDASTGLTEDGAYKQRHWIHYGDEKILLVNKRPYTDSNSNSTADNGTQTNAAENTTSIIAETQDTVENTIVLQALTKIPRQPEIYDNVAIINNDRTESVDVASQIEIIDDDE